MGFILLRLLMNPLQYFVGISIHIEIHFLVVLFH